MLAVACFPAMPLLSRLLLAVLLVPGLRADESRRFFDFAPVSHANPVVASIDDGRIEIPLSELRGYRDAEKLNVITDPASLAQKRAVLEDLLNEYLFVDEAYRTGVPDSPGFVRQMEVTRTMVLSDFMSMRAQQAAPPALDGADAGAALAGKLFESTDIVVSNEAYGIFKRAAGQVAEAGAALRPGLLPAQREEIEETMRRVVTGTPEAMLVRYADRTISLRQVLAIYAGLPAEKRPPVQTPAGFIDMIKPLILPELMVIEAVKRGIELEPAFRQKLIQNRNALLRFHAHGMVERRANELLQAPDLEVRLRDYHKLYQSFYVTGDRAGGQRPATYEESRAQVEGDYSVALRDRLLAEQAGILRRTRTVRIDEQALTAL